MGISCNTYLPRDTGIDDVINVMGILLGLEKRKRNFNDRDNLFWSCEVDRVIGVFLEKEEEKNYIIFPKGQYRPGFVVIEIIKNPIDNIPHSGFYHYENSDSNMICISGGNSKFWRMAGKGLVEFFGGFVDYNDCDHIDKDFEKEKPRDRNNPSDDEEWQRFQQELYDLKPLR